MYVEHLAYAMVRKKLPVNFNVRKWRNFCISRNVLEKVGKAGLMSLWKLRRNSCPLYSIFNFMYLQYKFLLSKSLAKTNIFYGLLNLCCSVTFPGRDSSFELLKKFSYFDSRNQLLFGATQTSVYPSAWLFLVLACWSKKSFLIEGTRVLRLPSDIQLVIVGDFPRQRAIKYAWPMPRWEKNFQLTSMCAKNKIFAFPEMCFEK